MNPGEKSWKVVGTGRCAECGEIGPLIEMNPAVTLAFNGWCLTCFSTAPDQRPLTRLRRLQARVDELEAQLNERV